MDCENSDDDTVFSESEEDDSVDFDEQIQNKNKVDVVD